MLYHYVIETLPNAEFKARTELERLGLTTTMPVQFKIRRHRRRRQPQQEIKRPIMPGYVVISGTWIPWIAIWALKSVRGVVSFDNQPALISDEVVEHIRKMETLPNDQRSPFKPGDEVTIVDSPWNNGIIKVESITDKKAQVIFEAFGAKRKATVSVDKLEAA
jgi:transcription antitermination factor NusG